MLSVLLIVFTYFTYSHFQILKYLKTLIFEHLQKIRIFRMSLLCQIPPPLTWHICQIIVDCLFLIVIACVMNLFHGHWLLSDALNFVISMVLNLEMHLKLPSLHVNGRGINYCWWINFFAFNIRNEVCVVLAFLSFLKKFGEKKTHNMCYLMLNPRFKSLRLVSSFIGRE